MIRIAITAGAYHAAALATFNAVGPDRGLLPPPE
jgi:hypothetical protein